MKFKIYDSHFFRFLILLFMLNIFYYPVYAEVKSNISDINENSTLQDMLQYAALNNNELQKAFYEWKSALENITPAKTLPDPKFEFGYFIKEIETRVGPQEWRIGLMQMFPWFGKLKLKGNIAADMANMKEEMYNMVKLKLFFKVKSLYYDLYLLNRKSDIINENMELLKHFEKIVQTKYMTATGHLPQVIKSQVELGMLEDKLTTLNKMKQVVIAQLNALFNREPGASLPSLSELPAELLNYQKKDAINLVIQNNPLLRKIRHEIKKEKHKLALARKNYYPNFMAGVSYSSTGEATMKTAESGKDPVMAMVSINLPIWTKKYRSLEAKSEKKIEAIQQNYAQSLNEFLAEIEKVFFYYEDAERKINLYRDTLIPKAQQAVKVTETAFTTAGKVDFLNLIDAQRILLNFELSYESALVSKNKQIAKLKMILGQL